MQIKLSQNANLILERVKKALKLSTDTKLAKFYNVRPNTISSWKKRDSLDFAKTIALCDKYKLDLNFVLLGKDCDKYSVDTSSSIAAENESQYNKEVDFKNYVGSEEFKNIIFKIIDEHEVKLMKSDLLDHIAKSIEEARKIEANKKKKES